MTGSDLAAAFLHDEAAALVHLEAVLWPDGPVCPRCGAAGRLCELQGNSTRPDARKCGHCRKPFTVMVGTVMVGTVLARSHVPLHKWMQAVCLLTCAKKGIGARQLHRILGVAYQTAWFMAHRLREAMRDGTLAPLGGFDGRRLAPPRGWHGDGRSQPRASHAR